MSKVEFCNLANTQGFHLFVISSHNLVLLLDLLLQCNTEPSFKPPCNQFVLSDFLPRLPISFTVISDTSLALF